MHSVAAMKSLNVLVRGADTPLPSSPPGRRHAAVTVTVAGSGDVPREAGDGDRCAKLRPHSSPPRYRSRAQCHDDVAGRSAGAGAGRGGRALCLPHNSSSLSTSQGHVAQFCGSDCEQCRCPAPQPSPAFFAPHPPHAPLQLREHPAREAAAHADAATSAPSPMPQVKGRSRNRRRVRSMLRELVARVPSAARQCAGRACSPLPPAPPPATPRWFARLAEEESGAGWAQGVRALRDAHVRLVQRQLRHLRRLNAAVDAASLHVPAH